MATTVDPVRASLLTFCAIPQRDQLSERQGSRASVRVLLRFLPGPWVRGPDTTARRCLAFGRSCHESLRLRTIGRRGTPHLENLCTGGAARRGAQRTFHS